MGVFAILQCTYDDVGGVLNCWSCLAAQRKKMRVWFSMCDLNELCMGSRIWQFFQMYFSQKFLRRIRVYFPGLNRIYGLDFVYTSITFQNKQNNRTCAMKTIVYVDVLFQSWCILYSGMLSGSFIMCKFEIYEIPATFVGPLFSPTFTDCALVCPTGSPLVRTVRTFDIRWKIASSSMFFLVSLFGTVELHGRLSTPWFCTRWGP